MEGKGWMWVNTLLNSLYDPKLRPHQWPLNWIFNVKNWIFNVKFSNNHSPGMEEPIDIERKDCESHIMLESPRHLELWHQPWFDIQVLDFKGLILEYGISAIGGSIDIKWKRCESAGWCLPCVILAMTLAVDFQGCILKITVFEESLQMLSAWHFFIIHLLY